MLSDLINFWNFFWANELFQKVFWSNTLQNYLISICYFALFYIIIKYIIKFCVKKLEKIVDKTDNDFDDLLFDVLSHLPDYFYLLIALYFPLKYLTFPLVVNRVFDVVFLIGIYFQLMVVSGKIIIYFFTKFLDKKGKKDDTTIHMFKILIRIVVYIIFMLMLLSTLGIAITPLLASLGVLGIAFAFAFQRILEDIFSSFSIYLDRPFKIGDSISTTTFTGTIKKIGIKTTRIVSVTGEEVVIPNKDLVNTQIHNFNVLKKRRIVFALGVTYETPTDKLQKIPEIMKSIFDKIEDVELDRAYFKAYGDFSLNFEIAYDVLNKDYKFYTEKEHTINIKIKEAFEKNGIDFAYPTQILYVKK